VPFYFVFVNPALDIEEGKFILDSRIKKNGGSASNEEMVMFNASTSE
jgi:hypothetical protein